MLKSTKKYIKKDNSLLDLKDFKKIEKLIQYHNELYYNKQEPIISDREYDLLYKKLQALEKLFNKKSKITSQVGAAIKESTFMKVQHSRPMISLDNTYNEEDLNDFDSRVKRLIDISTTSKADLSETQKVLDDNHKKNVEYILEYKFDGVGIELIYKKGKLVQAITRGNGVEGEDVTENIMQIDNIPKIINYKDHLEVRGEVVMPISVFENLNQEAKKEGTKVFANPRNAASGSIRLIDNSVTKKRKLKYFAYDLANFGDFIKKEKISEYYDVIKDLERFGFDISSYFKKFDGINRLINAIDNFGDLRQELDFEVDGLVVKVNSINLWQDIGSTEHHPRYAIAYKFPAEVLTTTLLDVEHSVGRTGTITPVAHLEAINISGVIVRRATLHNYEEVESLGVRIGDTVFIKRAGEVIPKIISVVKEGRVNGTKEILPPVNCPSCGTKVLKDDNKVRYYCPNKITCPIQNAEKLAWSIGKQGFNIDNLGEKQVELFLSLGLINNLLDIFYLKDKTSEILELEGFQEKSVNNLIDSIEKAKNINISNFITALGISGVGKKTAKTLSKIITSNESPIFNGKVSIEELESLEDIGPEIASNVFDYFSEDSDISNLFIVQKLINILNIEYYKPIGNLNNIINGIFFEKKVCITGSFEGYTRDDLIKLLEEKGGDFVSSVGKKTDFLIAGEKAGSKLRKAKELGVKTLNLTEFLKSL